MLETMKSERKRVTFVGRTNVGKSSLVNALLEQDLSIVSPIPGTTTDPTEKAIEILPAGPLLFTDTAGIDDCSPLGIKRVERVKKILKKTDFMVIVIAPPFDDFKYEIELLKESEKNSIPSVVVVNKIDTFKARDFDYSPFGNVDLLFVSARTKEGLNKLKEYIGNVLADSCNKGILDGIVKENDHVLIIIPVHHAYPKGRMKPLQVQIFREILDKNASFTVVKPNLLNRNYIESLNPSLIIIDSQIIKETKDVIPERIPVTSFSILLAKYKANLEALVESSKKIENLQEGDKVAIIEACTHHKLEGDMGREVIPELIKKITNKKLNFVFFSGVHQDFKEIEGVRFALHCGGCMLTERDMKSRQKYFASKNIPFTNYGVFLANYHGVLSKFTENLK